MPATPPVVWVPRELVSSAKLNRMTQSMIAEITPGPGINAVRVGNNVALSLAARLQPTGANVRLGVIFEPLPQGPGKYKIRLPQGSVVNSSEVTPLAMPEGLYVPDTADAVFYHLGENGSTSGHQLIPNTWIWGLEIGVSMESGLRVFVGGAVGGSTKFKAKITAFTSVAGRTNAWRYSWTEQMLQRDGEYVDPPDPRTEATTGFFAYNTIEANNGPAGFQGNSVNLDELPGGFGIMAVQGNPVVELEPMINCDGDTEMSFHYENAIGGNCEV